MPLLRSNNNNNKTGSEATPMLGTLGNQINQYNTNSPEAGSDKSVKLRIQQQPTMGF